MSRTDDPWLEWHVGLRDHPKTARLRRRLGIGLAHTVGLISLTWGWAVRYAPDGDLSRYDADVIADAAGWDDEPGVFVRALVAAGFVDDDMTIHDWDEYVGRLIDRRAANARRMKEAREAQKHRRANGSGSAHVLPDEAGTSGARASHVQGLHNITGPDLNRTGPDRTPTPQPPPPAGEGERRNPGRRRGDGIRGEDVTTPPPEVTDASVADRQLWESVRERLRVEMSAPNWDQLVGSLDLVGRTAAGGLCLRAPPDLGIPRVRPAIARALLEAGDAMAGMVTIVETSG
jgi:hypothetical protein